MSPPPMSVDNDSRLREPQSLTSTPASIIPSDPDSEEQLTCVIEHAGKALAIQGNSSAIILAPHSDIEADQVVCCSPLATATVLIDLSVDIGLWTGRLLGGQSRQRHISRHATQLV